MARGNATFYATLLSPTTPFHSSIFSAPNSHRNLKHTTNSFRCLLCQLCERIIDAHQAWLAAFRDRFNSGPATGRQRTKIASFGFQITDDFMTLTQASATIDALKNSAANASEQTFEDLMTSMVSPFSFLAATSRCFRNGFFSISQNRFFFLLQGW